MLIVQGNGMDDKREDPGIAAHDWVMMSTLHDVDVGLTVQKRIRGEPAHNGASPRSVQD
jgi:hypothetical protein